MSEGETFCLDRIQSDWTNLDNRGPGYLQGIIHEMCYLAKQDTIFCMISSEILYGMRKRN